MCLIYGIVFLSLYSISASTLIIDRVPISSSVIPSPDAHGDMVRLVTVYLPEEALTNPDKRFPVIYYLPGLGGTYQTFTVGNKAILDSLITSQSIIPMIVVHVDPSLVRGVDDTDGKYRYQGTWYVNGPLNGNFADFITQTLIPYIDEHYPTIPEAACRGVMGQSMGGFGSMYYVVNYPELFSFAGQASGTPFFILLNNTTDFAPEQPEPGKSMFVMNSLLLQEIPTEGQYQGVIRPENGPFSFSVFSYAAAFSPNLTNPPYFVDLPFEVDADGRPNLVTGDFIINSTDAGDTIASNQSLVPRTDVIERWSSYDPYRYFDAQKSLLADHVVYHDGGDIELINAVGARSFAHKMAAAGVPTIHFLYKGGHTTCLTSSICARHQTMFQYASACFARALYPALHRSELQGTGSIQLYDHASLNINDGVQLGITSTSEDQTDIALELHDNASLVIGQTEGAVLEVGNKILKSAYEETSFQPLEPISLLVQSFDQATITLNSKSVLGLGVGVDTLATDSLNHSVVSSRTNYSQFTFVGSGGELRCDAISSYQVNDGSLVLIGAIDHVSVSVDPSHYGIRGGSSIAYASEVALRHPVITESIGNQSAGGITTNLNDTLSVDDYFLHMPIGSSMSYRNQLHTGVVTSLDQRDNMVLPEDQVYSIEGDGSALYYFLANTENNQVSLATVTSKEALLSIVDGEVVLEYVCNGSLVTLPESFLRTINDTIDYQAYAERGISLLITISPEGHLLRIDPLD